MQIMLATQTLNHCNAAIAQDGGNAFRKWEGVTFAQNPDAYRSDEDGFRSHLGASVIGRNCAREIWYSFRWSTEPAYDGRMLRLWNRGHLEESRVVAMLLTGGLKVYQTDANGKQYRIEASDGHGGGSGDGVIEGMLELPPSTYVLLECKTHNDKSFNGLVDKGVRDSKFTHYVQSNIYATKMQLPYAVYIGVNKNDDHIHMEILKTDEAVAGQFLNRMDQIIYMDDPPTRLKQASPAWYECRFCDHMKTCLLKAPLRVGCRTCRFSEPRRGAGWHCRMHDIRLDKATQAVGCDKYEPIKNA